jgi:hypothetical protein
VIDVLAFKVGNALAIALFQRFAADGGHVKIA